MVFPLTVDQLGFVLAGFLSVLVISLSWALSKRTAFEKGYETGKHDRQHWEDDQIVRGKLEK